MSKLNAQQEAFCLEYFKDNCAKYAAVRAGYKESNAERTGSKLLTYPHIKARIEELKLKREERTNITADRVLREIGTMAFLNPQDVVVIDPDTDEKRPLRGVMDIQLLPEDVARAVVGWKWDKAGNFVLQFADKSKALDQLGRHLRLFSDRIEHTVDVTDLSDEELNERLKRIEQARKN